MPTTLRHPQLGEVVANTPEEVRDYISRGFTPVVQTTDFAGNPVIREGTADDTQRLLEGQVQGVQATPEIQQSIDARRQEELIRAEANRPEEQLLAAASRAASSATFGLTGAAGLTNTAGLDEGTRDILRQETRNAEVVGDILGAVSPVGAEALAVRTANRLVRGTSWGSTMGRMAFEGAAGGAINAASEAASEQDVSVFAERLAADTGIGALFGAGLGVPFGALGAIGRRIGRSNPLQEAAEGATEAVPAALRDPADALTPRSTGTIDDLMGSRGGIDFRNPDVQDAVLRSNRVGRMTPDEWTSRAADVSNVARRARQLEESLAQRLDDDLFRAIDGGEISPILNDGVRGARNLLDAVDVGAGTRAAALRGRVSRLLETSFDDLAPADMAARLSRVRNEMDEVVTGAGGLSGEGLEAIAPAIRDIQQNLDSLLGSSDIFGQEGAQQLAGRMQLRDRLRQSSRNVTSRFRERGGLLSGEVVDGLDINRLVQAMQTAANGGDTAVFRELRDLSETISTAGNVVDDFVPDGVDMARLNDFYQDLSARSADMRNRALEAGNQESFQAARQIVSGAGIAGGIVMGGPAGGALAAASGLLGVFRSPYARTRFMASLMGRTRQQGQRVVRSTQRVRSTLRNRALSPFVSRMRVKAGSMAALALNGSPEDQRQAFEAMADRIEMLNNSPAMLAQAQEGMFPAASALDERLPTAMGMQIYRQMAILASALPRSRSQMGLRSQIYAPRPPSQMAVSEFLSVAAVVEDPTVSLEMMAAGRLSQRAARAVQQAYPAFHAEMSAQFLRDIAEARVNGEPINYQASLQLSTFMGTPLDPTMEPSFNARVTSQSAQSPMQEQAQMAMPTSTRKPDLIQNEASPVERLMQ